MWRSSGANGEDSLMVRLEQMPGYLAARFTGIGPLRDVSQQFELIAERCKLTNADQSNFPPQHKFALYAAQNRGIDVWTFTDFKEAEEWLLK